jgi:hypothetical protein
MGLDILAACRKAGQEETITGVQDNATGTGLTIEAIPA